MEQKYWTLQEFAEHARLHLDTARRYVREGRLRATRVGKRYLVGQSEVEAFMANPAPPIPHGVPTAAASAKARAKKATAASAEVRSKKAGRQRADGGN
jgi:excisionase family DNA binding protein